MRRPQRRRSFDCSPLERRSLLSTVPIVPGNLGYIRRSQFQGEGFGEMGIQWRETAVGGPISIRELRPGGSGTPPVYLNPIVNTGNVVDGQFTPRGFSHVGTQFRRAAVRGAVAIDVYDESPAHSAGDIGLLVPPANSGDIEHSQFNDSGFGDVGMQWHRTRVDGDFFVATRTTYRRSDGVEPAPTTGGPSPDAVAGRGPASTNTGLVRNSQFNDGGFGNVGWQFRDVHVRGSVGVAMEARLVESPQPLPPGPTLGAAPPRAADATNIGSIKDSQFNDGGFGDVGLQWRDVKVGRSVASSTNTLSIQPRSPGGPAVDVAGVAFAQGWPAREPATGLPVRGAAGAAGGPLGAAAPGGGTIDVDATNSGLIGHSQFNDGGFGDVGMQWSRVRVRGGVGIVHNSLSIQPENAGQGLITVRDVSFPSSPAPFPAPLTGRLAETPAMPPIIAEDGEPVTTPLPARTRANDPNIGSDRATNSGVIDHSQFNDGGFGDVGMQWWDVKVGGDVRVVHNSLSVHPEGSDLAGVVVSNVRFGGPSGGGPGTARPILIDSQSAGASRTDVFLRWDGVARGYGVLIVSNSVLVEPGTNVTFDDVTFPEATAPASTPPALAAAGRRLLGAATNSGFLRGSQFNDGGFGDVGMQWRGVRVAGPVSVVHNTLSVDVEATGTGPISISDVAFESGVLPPLPRVDVTDVARSNPSGADGVEAGPRASRRPVGPGGQVARGGWGHAGLQWRDVRIRGPVTIVDNVLAVESTDPNAGPITISRVRYE